MIPRTARFLALILLITLLVSPAPAEEYFEDYFEDEVVDYDQTLFDTGVVHTVDIRILDEDWEDLKANPTEKTKYHVDAVIDGETVENVSFATKGNTSLASVASSDSDRYSFKLNFGKYDKEQTFHGLDKLNLNSAYSDPSWLKDYLSYRIFAEAGAEAPLAAFAALSINGEFFGLYVMVEEVDEAMITRFRESADGFLYKPEAADLDNAEQMTSFGGPEGRPGDFDGGAGFPGMPDGTPPAGEGGFGPTPDASFAPSSGEMGQMPPADGSFPGPGQGNAPDGFGGGFGSSSSASLVYTDDDPESYADIFDNAENKIGDEEIERLIYTLEVLNSEDGASVLDEDNVPAYFAAHNFLVNFDSYTGNMLHNYYLYEEDGMLSVFPWDYNLAFGTFMSASFSDAVNYSIDEPLDFGVSAQDRPLWNAVAQSETLTEAYRACLDALVQSYFESGRFEEEMDGLYQLLRPWVEKDPTAFYTPEEFDTAFETLKSFCLLRARSVRAQLDGTGEIIAADGLSLSGMGTQGGGGEPRR